VYCSEQHCIHYGVYNIAGMGNSKLLEGQFLENLNLAGQSIEKNK
jgi:hypothetical protein